MVGSCSAFNCTNRHTNRGSEKPISFHGFPKDEKLLEKWLINIKRANWTPSKSSQICSSHFSADAYETSGWSSKPRLKPDAVPTQFKFPNHLLKKEESLQKSHRKRKYNVTQAVDLILQQSECLEQNENSSKVENAV